jgi:hypothetical protein
VRDFRSPPFSLRAPCPLCCVSFLLLFLIIRFFFLFFLGGGQSVQRAMLIWPRVVYGSIACRLAHLVVHVFPSCHLVALWEPSWFLRLTWSGDARCGGVKVLPFLGGFSCKVYLQHLSKILL